MHPALASRDVRSENGDLEGNFSALGCGEEVVSMHTVTVL